MQRHTSSWRLILGAVLILAGGLWAILTTARLNDSWPVRDALARVELAREEANCSYRMGGTDNQQRCRDLAQLISRGDSATAYFNDGLIILGPALLLFVVAGLLFRGRREHRPPHRTHPRLHHHGHSAA